jgi:hypothetical protein
MDSSSSSGGARARRRSSGGGGGGSSSWGSFSGDGDPFDIPAKGAPVERLKKWRVSRLLLFSSPLSFAAASAFRRCDVRSGVSPLVLGSPWLGWKQRVASLRFCLIQLWVWDFCPLGWVLCFWNVRSLVSATNCSVRFSVRASSVSV